MKTEQLIHFFKEEAIKANEQTFPIYVQSFTHLWTYKWGTLENIPEEIDDLITTRALELGLIQLKKAD
ncbi:MULTISPECIES: hypothetical protein [Priestia]|jgi:hypothetical protein|uniref:hypothetical protein n=1 Tax=Priestia TaxID=2800373 RepID=UPI00088D3631|nr:MULTISPECIES: hypothetical protein [Priestia]MBK0007544.1 hypothetical protein [Bacillus sp. S35]SDC58508.1 hypothetical protein SAMN04487777_1011273 [Priestia aryabhattai B8W22]MCM3250530.1 hypothetical protein [Priestia aryabhattai]MCM3642311.1 hypothetical protein [Priestia aryabhattai]PFW72207.1 hypothetical protein COL23_21745 [Priestia aryabhattai]